MLASLALFSAVCGSLASAAARVDYAGYRIISANCDDEFTRLTIQKMASHADRGVLFAEDHGECRAGRYADLIVSPAYFEIVSALPHINATVLVDDLGLLFAENKRAELLHPYRSYKESANVFFEAYRDLDEIVDYFDNLCAEFATRCVKFSIGTSYEGRDLFAYRVTAGNNSTGKVRILYNGWIHPREWIAGTSLQYTMDWLIRGGNGTTIVDDAVMEFIPVLNPDGYEWTRTVDNLWRKSRQPNNGFPACPGTDLNRNWQFEWGTVGSSPVPCSDTYHGTTYFDNPETEAISNYMIANADIVSHIDWHAYSRYVMYPWGCYTQLPPQQDYQLFQQVGEDMCDAIASVRNTAYTHGSISDIIYEAAGSSADYVYGQLDRLFALAYEIGNAFQPPVSEIEPTGQELLQSTIAHVEYVVNYYNLKNNRRNSQ